ncbi:metalloregulator ArsR/SmtB family transcription factor [Cellulomonas cellasea]|uniref:ArsR family transcriptional regulator n=1 Tax=Cellulomonas cellasea TaxID=43670 RepID=A0A7W4YED8_9CELL|nr:metalloregulator ArsR/SmtB family transcription factor [Cellulomonas cellasea]MBB2925481.1 ArsR family transcriptional regulator [Cellulomonas cellasea]
MNAVTSSGTAGAPGRAMGTETAGQVAVMLKALADPLRLRMLSFLTTSPAGEACVCDIATVADVSQPTVSHHLKVLKDVGILVSERRGTWVWYRVAPPVRGPVTALLESFAPAALDAARHLEPPTGGRADVDAELSGLADELADRFPDAGAGEVLHMVRESSTALVRHSGAGAVQLARVRRFAEQRLTDLACVTSTERRAPQVLFVCVANAGRSQLAAALVRRYAGDAVVARSAGSAPAAAVHATVAPLLRELGVDPSEVFPKPLTDDAVRAADVVVTMGCGDTCPVLPGTRYEDWVVGDPGLASPEGAAAIRDDIDARVRALLADLAPDLTLPTAVPTSAGSAR